MPLKALERCVAGVRWLLAASLAGTGFMGSLPAPPPAGVPGAGGDPQFAPLGYLFSQMNSQMGSPLGMALVMYHLYCGFMTSAIPSHIGWNTLHTSMG